MTSVGLKLNKFLNTLEFLIKMSGFDFLEAQQILLSNPWWVDRLNLKKTKFESKPTIRKNDEALTRYGAEIGKLKNMDNISWKKLGLNDARFEKLKETIKSNRKMLAAMGEALEPLTRSTETENNDGEIPQDQQIENPEVENNQLENDIEMQDQVVVENQPPA